MKGFREFLMRGNLVELAVAVIMGTAFAAVVKSFTNLILDVIGKFGKIPDFSGTSLYGISVGAFLSSLLAFVLTAVVVYFFVVVPYNKLSNLRKTDQPEVAASSEDLLAEIRDILREQASGNGSRPTPAPPPRT